MKIECLKNDTYRVRKMVKGVAYTAYFDHEPTQKEALIALAEKMQSAEQGAVKGSFESYCDKYIESRENILSPSTIAGYKKLKKYLSPEFKRKNLYDIGQFDIDVEINKFSSGHAPKYVRNLHGFISAVLRTFRPSMKISTSLPQKKKFEHNLPTEEAVKKILEASKGSPYHIAFQLAVLGMRRSEICGATIDDLNGNTLTINKASLYDENYKVVTRDNTKTEASTREIYLPDDLVQEINEAGEIFRYNPQALTRALHKYQDMLGLERFRLHDFRGYFASYAHSLGIPDIYIIKMGGWKTDHVMKAVYRDALKDKNKEMQQKITESLFGDKIR